MAYSNALKQQAMSLYAAGLNRQQIADQLSKECGKTISHTTIARWYEDKVPEDWDAFRAEVDEKKRIAVVDQLKEKKTNLALQHFDMWDQLQLQIKRVQYEEILDDRGLPTGEYKPRQLTAFELNQLAGAATRVQVGQRTVFGQHAYAVELVRGAHVKKGDLPDDLVAAFEDRAAEVLADPAGGTTAGPGDPDGAPE